MLGPGKFIESQINIEAQVANLAGHRFMAQAEGVERPRIKTGLAARFKGKGSTGEFMLADIAVNVVEHGRIAVEIQVFFTIFIEEDQEFLVAMTEQEIFLLCRHNRAVENEFPQIAEGVAAQFLIIVGIGFDQDIQQLALTFLIDCRVLGKFPGEFTEMFQNDADGLDHGRSQGNVDIEHLDFDGLDEFVEFPRRQLEDHLAQKLRHVFRNLRVADFQTVEQFHCQFVALGIGHTGSNLEQTVAGGTADENGFTDLEQVGQMSPEMHDAAGVALAVDIAQHEFQVGHLDDPVSPHLEVDEEEIAFPFKKSIPPFGQVHDFEQILIVQVIRIRIKDVAGTAESGDAQVEGFALLRRFDEGAGGSHKGFIQISRVHIGQDLQEDDIFFFTVIAPFIIGSHDSRITGTLGQGTASQHSRHEGTQAITDPQLVLLCKADIRADDAVQVGREQGQVGHGLGRQGDAFRQFFRIGIVEIGDDAPHESCRLQADVSFAVGQEFIEELQGHEFLMLRHIRRIFLKDADIRADILPQPFTAGRFDEVAEIAFVAEDAHEADIVVDGGIFELGNDIIAFEEDLFPMDGLRRIGRFPGKVGRQFRNDAVFFHEGFKVCQFGIDFLITLALGFIDIIQFA